MMDSYLLEIVAKRRGEDWRREAERERRAAAGRSQRNIRWRSGNVTVEIHLSPDLRPEQIDQIFASIACHLDLHRT